VQAFEQSINNKLDSPPFYYGGKDVHDEVVQPKDQ